MQPDARVAAIEAAAAARAGLDGAPADLAVVFASGVHMFSPEATLEGVHEALLPRRVLGCGAGGILGEGRELERGNGIAVWAVSLFGGEAQTTNNRMELMAVIQALKALKKPCEVSLHIDSQYVLKGMTEWLPGWKAKGWRTAAKQPVKNVELWKALDDLVREGGHRIAWHWVRGHDGNPGNERADALANRGVEQVLGAR